MTPSEIEPATFRLVPQPTVLPRVLKYVRYFSCSYLKLIFSLEFLLVGQDELEQGCSDIFWRTTK